MFRTHASFVMAGGLLIASSVVGCTLDFESQFASKDGAGGSGLFGGGGQGGGGVGATGGTTLDGDVLRFGEHTDADFPGGSADAYLDSDDQAENFGASSSLIVKDGQFVSLLRFEISSLPDDPTGAELSLYVPHKEDSDDLIEIYQVLEPWDEGTESADIGACNWAMRTELEPWTDPGVGPAGSRGGEALAEFTPSQDRARYRIALPKDLVEDWHKDPTQNFGIVLVGVAADPANADSARFDSGDNDSSDKRPFLDVSF